MNRIFVKPGAVFLREGEPGEDAYFLEDGLMEVIKKIGNKDAKISELGPGSIFGELCLIDQQVRSASVRALEKCTVHRISQTNIESIVRKNPTVALAIIRTLTARLRTTLATL
jgi:CRP-like cAMP-binding protein